MPTATAAPVAGKQLQRPLIPEEYLDIPSQRLYVLSIGLLCQAIKVFDFLRSLLSTENASGLTFKWLLTDALYCLTLKWLRIPRLNYAVSVVLLQVIALWFVDGLLFDGVNIGVTRYSFTNAAREYYWKELSSAGRLLSLHGDSEHLKGEHTVRMSPISTARLNPSAHSYCLSAPQNMVLIPVLLNNTQPSFIRYTLSHPSSAKAEAIDIGPKELKAIEQAQQAALKLTRSHSEASVDDEGDWDPDDAVDDDSLQHTGLSGLELEKTQTIAHLKVTKPGILRLERVVDSVTSTEARIFPVEVSITPCPRAEFEEDTLSNGDNIRCAGYTEKLTIKVFGMPPLGLSWHREINGRKEHFSIERIEGTSNAMDEPQELRIPLDMQLNEDGQHLYVLDSVSDGLGNQRILSTPSSPRKQSPQIAGVTIAESTRKVTVLTRATFAFRDCGPGNPASLFMGKGAPLYIAASEGDTLDAPWDVTVQYQTPQSLVDGKKKLPKPWKKTFTTPPEKTWLTINVDAPGDYTLLDVRGRHCAGDVLNPETCRVVEQPFPSADIEWKRIHECSGDTGVSAYLVLHGKPPFRVYYLQQRNNDRPTEQERLFQGSRGEITLQPESSGNYTYTFSYLSDTNYKRVRLDGPSINQVVHPLATASFVFHGAHGVGNKRTISSCSGSSIEVEVELRGNGPWNLELQTVGPKGLHNIRVPRLKHPRETLHITIPPDVDAEGGTFQIDLVSIEDANGCRKELAVPGVSVSVRRVQPSVRFYGKNGLREITTLDRSETHLPLRLSGEGPWRVKYKRVEPPGPATTVVLYSPNDNLVVHERGVYALLEVSDSQCPGNVLFEESDFTVNWIPRPVAKLAPTTEAKVESYNNSFIRTPICEGATDHVELDLTGRPPFQVMYNVARDNEAGGTKILEQPVISSVQSRTRFQLRTSSAGRMYYEVKQIGDANYPLAQNQEHVIPRRDRLLFEQEVLARPSAYFRSSARLSYCLRDRFSPQNSYTDDDLIILEGKPPFFLQISVKSLATSETHQQTIELHRYQWRLNLPTYTFTSIGPHLVTIQSVRDASSCEQADPAFLRRSIWVDIAESAAIVPFDRREHYCVGDVTQFQLEGSPPWTISYKIGRKHHDAIAKQSPFVLVQQQPGDVAITSISHQHKMCKTAVDNISLQVHAQPSAQVAHGRDYYENIHEGAQAQIIFSLVGEPPFTFTYQRAETPARKGAKPGKVLETHTVSGVMSHEYSIYSALEGTWTVTFISDKYCRFPPVQPDVTNTR